jgi:uroporphyrinogen-III synthase
MPASAASREVRLAGRRVLLTRPQPESRALAARIAAAGGAAIVFPTLEIQPVALSAASQAALQALGRHRLAVFVSANAVRHGMPLVRSMGGWPSGLAAAAVGNATAELLRTQGLREVLVPQTGADSEALLACRELQQVAGASVVVFRGEGGRELLADTLRARGAQVGYIECYRRAMPQTDPAPVRSALDAHALDAVVAASAEGVRNLLHLVGPEWQAALRSVPLIVTHPNVGEAARSLGFERVALAPDAEEGVVDCLADVCARHA